MRINLIGFAIATFMIVALGGFLFTVTDDWPTKINLIIFCVGMEIAAVGYMRLIA
jgi:hypothetical protein